MPKRKLKEGTPARERLLDAAYDLFAVKGVNRVGIDAILAKSRCAKASLYDNFESKVNLAIAFLDRREQIWTRGWLESDVRRRTEDPKARLLAIFDVFDGWFRQPDFEGCSFINVLLEFADPSDALHRASRDYLAHIRAFVERLLAAGCPRVLTDPDPANARAIRAYRKAGFSGDREVTTPEGRALLLIRDNDRTLPA